MVLVRDESMVLGSNSSQVRLIKTLSNRSSVGVLRLLDQMKFQERNLDKTELIDAIVEGFGLRHPKV